MAKTKLYLMRHATAEDGDAMDAGRQVTDDGRADFQAVLAMAKDAGVDPDCVLSSPFDRAVDSARMVADFFGIKKKNVVQTDDLLPDAMVDKAWLCIANYLTDYDETIVICHQPLLGQLVNKCLGCSGLAVKFKTCSMMRVDFDSDEPSTSTPSGIMRWFVTPKIVGDTDN